MSHFEHRLPYSETIECANHFSPPNTRRDIFKILTVSFPIFPSSRYSNLGLLVKAASPFHLVQRLDQSAIHHSDTKSL